MADGNPLIALLTLSAMEIVLGVDNIVFIAILVGKLPPKRRDRIRRAGIGAALLIRIALLFTLSWLMGLEEPFISVLGKHFSGRDLILAGGGLFLIAKAAHEMYDKLEGPEVGESERKAGAATVAGVLSQILLLDIVFSLDSVITAVGMADLLWVMIVAMVVAVVVMLLFSGKIVRFVDRHPTIKILALAFLLLIGVTLVAEGLGQHLNKGYIYFAMGFALAVELANMRFRKVREPLHLHAGTEHRVAARIAARSYRAEAGD